MDIISLLILAVGLSMDAFAVSVCKGLALKKVSLSQMVVVGFWFGGFQALMPVIGYYLGKTFSGYITAFDHWIAFGLLAFIGINMILESRKATCETTSNDLGFKTMLLMAVATSIDALAVGISLAFLNSNIWVAAIVIGIVTFILSLLGVKIGNKFGDRFGAKAELAGGIILVLLGTKILLEHLGII
mgnify:FL=1